MIDSSPDRSSTATAPEALAPVAPAGTAPRSTRNARVVAACVIAFGLAVAGLLVWKAATDRPSGPSSDTTASTAVTGGPTG